MSSETKVSPPSDELGGLLSALGREPLPPERTPEDEQARAERMAERIDDALARMVRARRTKRRAYAALSLAAAAALILGGVAFRGDRGTPATIQPETPSAARARGLSEPKHAPITAPGVASAVPSVVAPPRPATERGKRPSTSVEASPNAEDAGTAALEPAAPDSTLQRENQLFREAAEAARTGDVERALTRLDELVVNYPTSPLAQTAVVRRFRLLVKTGRGDEARREAARYLQQYPTGFAVNEARELTTSPIDAGAAPMPERALP